MGRPFRAGASPGLTPRPASSFRRIWLAALAIAAAGLWAYANSFSGAFVFDDTPAIVENPHIRTLRPLTRSMSAPPEVTVSGRPIAAFTLAINYALAPIDVRDVMAPGGPGTPAGTGARYLRNVWGYHAFNLAIHLGAALTLFGVIRRTLLSPGMRDHFGQAATPLAFAVALLWVVHPLQTESVTYIVQRVESLMGLFYLLTLYCAIRAWDASEASSRLWGFAAIVACALGMGSKEVMVSAPVTVAVWDFVFASRLRSPGFGKSQASSLRWPLYAGLASTWLILVVVVYFERRGQSVGFDLGGWTPWTYLLTQSEVIMHYLALAVAPLWLVIDYGWPKVTTFGAVWPEFVGLSLALAATIVGVARRHPLGFAGAVFFLTLAPSSSVLPIVTEIAAEHRMYLPLAAILATIVIGLYEVASRIIGSSSPAARQALWWAAVVSVAAAAIALVLMTRHRNLDYVSQETLWRDAIEKRPSNVRARVTYGLELFSQGRHTEAEAQLRTAVRLDETNGPAQLNLGVVLCSAGKFDEGIARLERALSLNPANTQIYGNLGEAYAAQGRVAPALKYFQLALETRPDDLFLLNRAGWLLATSTDPEVRNGPRAVDLASRATRLTNGQDVVSLDTLAAAYAEVSRFADASATAAEAIRLAGLQRRADILPEIEARLALYSVGRPFRQ